MKLLDPRIHGYLDYLFDLVFYLAPSLFGMSPLASAICYAVATVHLLMNLATAYPLGALKWIPFPTHGAVELVASVVLVCMPWFAGFAFMDDAGRNFFVLAGLVLFAVWATTDYRRYTSAVESRLSESRPTFRRVS